MSRLIQTLCALLIVSSVGLGQNQLSKAKLLGSFDTNFEDVLNEIDKAGMAVETTFKSQSDILAVRVCSDEPFPIALALSAGAAFLTASRLQNFGIPKSSIYYLRYNDCRVRSNNYGQTEYWFVPENAEFPDFVEARRSLYISGYEITHAGYVATTAPFDPRSAESQKLTPQLYVQTFPRVLKLLEDNKSAVAIIVVPYYRLARNTELNKSLNDILRYLRQEGIASHRIHVKKINPGHKVASSDNQAKYPDIFVVAEN